MCDANVASYPVPRPAFRRLQYGTASDEKLGVGLGTRLLSMCMLIESLNPLFNVATGDLGVSVVVNPEVVRFED